jgi:hypothetical protein
VDRLASMGFESSEAAQDYIACDKNEELAAICWWTGIWVWR